MMGRCFLTVHEVAETLKVSDATVRSWIRERKLRGIKFGKGWRVDAQDLEAFIDDHANR